MQSHVVQNCGLMLKIDRMSLAVSSLCCCVALTVLWTLKSDREAISLSSSSVADVADGFAALDYERHSMNYYLTEFSL